MASVRAWSVQKLTDLNFEGDADALAAYVDALVENNRDFENGDPSLLREQATNDLADFLPNEAAHVFVEALMTHLDPQVAKQTYENGQATSTVQRSPKQQQQPQQQLQPQQQPQQQQRSPVTRIQNKPEAFVTQRRIGKSNVIARLGDRVQDGDRRDVERKERMIDGRAERAERREHRGYGRESGRDAMRERGRDTRDSRDMRDDRDMRDMRDNRDGRGMRDARDGRDLRDRLGPAPGPGWRGKRQRDPADEEREMRDPQRRRGDHYDRRAPRYMGRDTRDGRGDGRHDGRPDTRPDGRGGLDMRGAPRPSSSPNKVVTSPGKQARGRDMDESPTRPQPQMWERVKDESAKPKDTVPKDVLSPGKQRQGIPPPPFGFPPVPVPPEMMMKFPPPFPPNMIPPPFMPPPARGTFRGRGRGRGQARVGNSRGVKKSYSVLAMRNVPEDKLKLPHLLKFFEKYGTPDNVQLVTPDRAFIIYSERDPALAAVNSVDAVMGNRHIKLGWATKTDYDIAGLELTEEGVLKPRAGGRRELRQDDRRQDQESERSDRRAQAIVKNVGRIEHPEANVIPVAIPDAAEIAAQKEKEKKEAQLAAEEDLKKKRQAIQEARAEQEEKKANLKTRLQKLMEELRGIFEAREKERDPSVKKELFEKAKLVDAELTKVREELNPSGAKASMGSGRSDEAANRGGRGRGRGRGGTAKFQGFSVDNRPKTLQIMGAVPSITKESAESVFHETRKAEKVGAFWLIEFTTRRAAESALRARGPLKRVFGPGAMSQIVQGLAPKVPSEVMQESVEDESREEEGRGEEEVNGGGEENGPLAMVIDAGDGAPPPAVFHAQPISE